MTEQNISETLNNIRENEIQYEIQHELLNGGLTGSINNDIKSTLYNSILFKLNHLLNNKNLTINDKEDLAEKLFAYSLVENELYKGIPITEFPSKVNEAIRNVGTNDKTKSDFKENLSIMLSTFKDKTNKDLEELLTASVVQPRIEYYMMFKPKSGILTSFEYNLAQNITTKIEDKLKDLFRYLLLEMNKKIQTATQSGNNALEQLLYTRFFESRDIRKQIMYSENLIDLENILLLQNPNFYSKTEHDFDETLIYRLFFLQLIDNYDNLISNTDDNLKQELLTNRNLIIEWTAKMIIYQNTIQNFRCYDGYSVGFCKCLSIMFFKNMLEIKINQQINSFNELKEKYVSTISEDLNTNDIAIKLSNKELIDESKLSDNIFYDMIFYRNRGNYENDYLKEVNEYELYNEMINKTFMFNKLFMIQKVDDIYNKKDSIHDQYKSCIHQFNQYDLFDFTITENFKNKLKEGFRKSLTLGINTSVIDQVIKLLNDLTANYEPKVLNDFNVYLSYLDALSNYMIAKDKTNTPYTREIIFQNMSECYNIKDDKKTVLTKILNAYVSIEKISKNSKKNLKIIRKIITLYKINSVIDCYFLNQDRFKEGMFSNEQTIRNIVKGMFSNNMCLKYVEKLISNKVNIVGNEIDFWDLISFIFDTKYDIDGKNIENIIINGDSLFVEYNAFDVCFRRTEYFASLINLICQAEILKIVNHKKIPYLPFLLIVGNSPLSEGKYTTHNMCVFYNESNECLVYDPEFIESTLNQITTYTFHGNTLYSENNNNTIRPHRMEDFRIKDIGRFFGGDKKSFVIQFILFISCIVVICLLIYFIVSLTNEQTIYPLLINDIPITNK